MAKEDSTALVRIEKAGDAALARLDKQGLDHLIETFQRLPFKTKLTSHNLGYFVFERAEITIDGITVSHDINPRIPDKTFFGAVCYMKERNFRYAELLLIKSLERRMLPAGGMTLEQLFELQVRGEEWPIEKPNERNRKLLTLLVLAQYALQKYSKAIKNALRLYEADHRKVARKLVAQIAVKLDGEIGKLEQKINTPLYDGFVRMSDRTKSRLLKERSYLLDQRRYAGQALNYMKGNQFLREAKETAQTNMKK